uniref:HDC10271 n=1 Tax=Drosophila melanogaster TaxID=7227 RepID=Q6IL63_DROME|nr:TPA_inf: HDC10271 [Drosophila melanogaster]
MWGTKGGVMRAENSGKVGGEDKRVKRVLERSFSPVPFSIVAADWSLEKFSHLTKLNLIKLETFGQKPLAPGPERDIHRNTPWN